MRKPIVKVAWIDYVPLSALKRVREIYAGQGGRFATEVLEERAGIVALQASLAGLAEFERSNEVDAATVD